MRVFVRSDSFSFRAASMLAASRIERILTVLVGV
jgi:hypothetical protein